MSFPFPPPWASGDRGILAPIPLRPTWQSPTTVFCGALPWTSGPWLFPTSAWAMELLQTMPNQSMIPSSYTIPPPAGPPGANPIPPPPGSIFPSPFIFRAPIACQCCPPPSVKSFPMLPPPIRLADHHPMVGCNLPVRNRPRSSLESKRSPPHMNREYRCTHCFKSYNTPAAFHMHLRTHVQGCQCPICGKSFSRHWLLQGHIRTHTGEKPFSCPRCGKAFADKSNLRAHVQTHSGLKPYACGRCGKAFALKSYLSKHEESACVKPMD